MNIHETHPGQLNTPQFQDNVRYRIENTIQRLQILEAVMPGISNLLLSTPTFLVFVCLYRVLLSQMYTVLHTKLGMTEQFA